MSFKAIFEFEEGRENAEVLDTCLVSRVLPESVVEQSGALSNGYVEFVITFASIEDARKFTQVYVGSEEEIDADMYLAQS